MKHRGKIFPHALGTISLLMLLLFPLSLFSQNSSLPSPDFDGNGVVEIPDFLLFVDAFGSKEGQEGYEPIYDLDGNGEIGISDFLIFVDNFGKAVKRLPPTCMPTSGHLHPNGTLSDRAGQYQLTLVEVVNGTDARSAQGTLTLRQQIPGLDSLGNSATPLYGFTDVNLRAVGAYEVGDPDSEDPQAPGVLVLESNGTGARRILLRLGADANRRDNMLFDGAYTVLDVQKIADDGFAGTWRSGLRLSLMEGYFCARTSTQGADEAEFSFTFQSDAEGWTAGFADLPANFDQSIYELDAGYRPLPSGLEGNGLYIQGHNRSDDLFMFFKRRINGLKADVTYSVLVSLDLATNVPFNTFGIGGSPGESVYVKVGASTVEPVVGEDNLGHLRMNIDKGNQSYGGESMVVIGNVAHPEVSSEEFRLKSLDNADNPVTVTTDSEGRLWLIVGTDSGFEGLSTFYYARIAYRFLQQSP